MRLPGRLAGEGQRRARAEGRCCCRGVRPPAEALSPAAPQGVKERGLHDQPLFQNWNGPREPDC